jgi:hypothetical protein
MDEPTYQFRLALTRPEATYRLTDSALVWSERGVEGRLPFSDIRQVRIYRTPGVGFGRATFAPGFQRCYWHPEFGAVTAGDPHRADRVRAARRPGRRWFRREPGTAGRQRDPVASGIVNSLARPEENVTGFSNFLPATTGKMLELIKTAIPFMSRVAFICDPANPGKLLELGELQAGGPVLGVAIEPREVRTSEDIENAFAAMADTRPQALIVPSDSVTVAGLRRIVELAAKIQMPTIYQSREFVELGGLMSYGLSVCKHYRRTASYIDKILKGARPADLPVEQPSTFEYVINLRTAKALHLELPAQLLAFADEVIE